MPGAPEQAAVNAEELRKALANWKHAEVNWTNRTVEAAARFWLSLLEGDEALVEKVEWCEEHGQCKMACGLEDDDGMYPPSLDHRFVERLLVLAAITEGRT